MRITDSYSCILGGLRKCNLTIRTFIAAAMLCTQTMPLMANPVDGVVSAGSANMHQAGNTLTVTQQTDKAVIDWRGFDIAKGETTRFVQPSSASVTLNRIGGNTPSFINGNLNANGNLILVNPNGVWFGNGARVDVNGLIASTADISNDAFMKSTGIYNFDKAGNPDATVINDGLITAKEAGLVGLVAPNVINRGIILAKLGRVALASGDTSTVDLYGDGLIKVAVSDKVKSQLVSNSGVIAADGGTIALTAAAGKNIVNSLITVPGELAAPSIQQHNGKIIIAAEGANKTSKHGSSKVLVSGILDASGRNAGEHGGSILVAADNIGLLNGTRIDASGSDGLSGTTLGKLVSAVRKGSAGGDIRIGGDYLGQGNTPTALNLYVDHGALILNDAINSGDAGRTIFWSDGTTQFYGNVYARALAGNGINPSTWHANETNRITSNTGDGGFVETSGHGHLDVGGYVDLTSSHGARGTYFLDPTNITIYGNFAPNYSTVIQGDATALSANLKLWVDASDTTKVNLTYSALTTAGANACASSCLTASGTSGATTITTSANVAAALKIGQRIRLGAAGSITAVSTLGADTYTISGISGTTITFSSPLTTTYTSSTVYGGYVSQLTDKSGLANNATQATAASMPLWISNGQNSIGTISLDGVNDYLNLTSSISLTDFNASTVGNKTATNTDYTPLGGAASYTSLIYLGSAFVGQFFISGGSSYSFSSANPTNTANPTVFNWQVSSTNPSLYFNGVSYPFANTVTGTIIFNEIGGRGDNAFYTNGKIDEIALYNAALSTNARNLVDQYQSAKWGIALTPPGSGATEAAQATASIQKGDAVDGYSVFTTRYLERLSQSANISLQASNNITLDFQGDTMNFATAGRTLTLTAGNQITTASTGTITTNNASISMYANDSIAFNNNFTLNSNGGAILLNADRDASGAGAVKLSGTVINSAGGNVTIGGGSGTITAGTGYAVGTATYQDGVLASGGSINAAGGNIIINGKSAVTATSFISGISLDAAANVNTTGAGTISMYGLGNTGSGTSNRGVRIVNGSIVSGQHGNITLNGTGGGSGVTANDYGVFIGGTGGFVSTSGSGSINIVGVGGAGTGGINYGVYITNAGSYVKTTGTGNISITGTAGTGASSFGFLTDIANAVVTSGTAGNITLLSDTDSLSGAGAGKNISSVGSLTIAPLTSITMGVGTSAGGALNFTDTVLGALGAASFTFGSVGSGNLTVNTAKNFSTSNVTFISGGTLSLANTLTTTTGNVTFNNPVNLTAASIVNAGTGTINFTGTINGAFGLTASAATISLGGAIGGTTALGAVSLTSMNGITLPSITASTINVQTNAAAARLVISAGLTANATTGTGISLNAGNEVATSAAASLTTGGSAISITGANGIGIYHAYNMNTVGGAVTFNSALYLGAALSVNSGAGNTTFASTINSLNLVNSVNALVVAGGGGGGGGTGGGGGGGGVLNNTAYAVATNSTNTVTVGSGGATGSGIGFAGTSGGNSVFGTLTAIGGGGGGANNNINGLSGGSGGGGAWNSLGASGTVGQGFAGAQGAAAGAPNYGGGGGGGAGGAGTIGTTTTGGVGGAGVANTITGSSVTYAGGGGGGVYAGGTLGAGGSGGGGAGGSNAVSGGAGTNGLGGGGGGAGNNTGNGGGGGSGVVIVRYTGRIGQANVTNGTATTVGNGTVWTFTSSGSFTANSVGCASGCGLTVNAGTISMSGAIGGTTALGAVSLTSTNSMTLPAITASSINVQTTSATADINTTASRYATTGASGITLNAGRDINFATTMLDTSAANSPVSLTAVGTANIAPVNTGTGNFTVNANDANFYGADLTTNLVDYWTLNEGSGLTANDSVGANNAGTLTNGPTWSSSTPSASGSSVSFDGVNDYIALGNSPITGSGAFTLSAWINTSTVSKYSGAIAIGSSASNLSAYIGTVQGAQVGTSNSIGGGLYGYNIGSGITTTGSWAQVALTYSGGTSGTLNLYVNGVLRQTGTGTANITSTPASLGRIGTDTIYNFVGLVDDARIYNTALQSNVVGKIYSGTNTWSVGTTTINATNNVNFDLKGDAIAAATGKNISVTAGNSINGVSAGSLTASKNAGVGGDITMTATAGTSDTSNLTLTSTGGAATITSAGAMNLGNVSASSIVVRTTDATSDVTLTAGKVLNAAGTGDAITLVSARNFINNAGAGALTASSGRWLAYSTNPASDTIGGLSNSFRRFSCTYGGSCPAFPGTGNGLLYTATPVLTITPNTLSSIVYGAAAPNLSGYAYSASGYLGSDASVDILTGSLTGSSTYIQGSNVGTYNINYGLGTLSSAMGYGVSYANNASAISVTPRPLTIVADSKTKVYGASDPALTYQLTSGSLYNTDVLTGALSRTAGETVAGGPYTINQNTLSAGSNYTISYTNNTLSITPAGLTVTANAQTKVYGAADPTLTYGVSGLTNGDTNSVFTGALSRTAGETVVGGPYAIGQNTLSAGSNYTISYTGNNLSITPATLTITANAQTKIYGSSDPTLSYGVSGLANGDTNSVLTGVLARATGENVGSYGIGQNTLSAGNNYTISFAGNNLSITRAALTVTANAQSKIHGAVDPTFTYNIAGLANGDTNAVFTGALSRAVGENVGSYAINQNTLAAGNNYTINYTGNNLSITLGALTVRANAISKVYGNADPALTYTVSGLTNGDTASILTGALSRTAGETVAGGPYAINQNTLSAGSNYTLIYVGNYFTINPALLRVIANPQNKFYGEVEPALTYWVNGLKNGDTRDVVTGELSRHPGSDAGVYEITRNTIAASSNYDLRYISADFTIIGNPIPVTVTRVSQDPTLVMSSRTSGTGTSSGLPSLTHSSGQTDSNSSGGNGNASDSNNSPTDQIVTLPNDVGGAWLRISPALAAMLGATTNSPP